MKDSLQVRRTFIRLYVSAYQVELRDLNIFWYLIGFYQPYKTITLSSPFSLKGQERYGNMTRVYYREAVGALVVFDMTRLSTFQAVLKWKGDLDSKVNMFIVMF